MRLVPYILLAYLALGLQVGLGRYMEWNGAQPNFVLLAVVFIAVNAPRDAALLGGFSMGVLQDLMSQQPPGLYGMAYGVVAMILSNTQTTVYRGHPLTHVSLAALGGVVTAAMLWLHSIIWAGSSAADPSPIAVRLSLVQLLLAVMYTALLAPFVIGPLQRIRRGFAFTPNRKGMR
ncbi:MAG TPA: rod shape-determining protein MreD [Tepidisphaeraceae bacterium]|jgi:rod shape-determining protein MreD|nr:rod shape-determining protein MreD [Tepidisphaeraceae bacterium]